MKIQVGVGDAEWARKVRKFCQVLISGLVLAGLSAFPAQAEHHSGKTIGSILIDSRDCIFFNLVGIVQADPQVPGTEWFALPKTHPKYAEINAMLLTAKAGGMSVSVTTTGQASCSHASVGTFYLD